MYRVFTDESKNCDGAIDKSQLSGGTIDNIPKNSNNIHHSLWQTNIMIIILSS